MVLSGSLVIDNSTGEGTRATVLPQYIHNDIVFAAGDYVIGQDLYIDPDITVEFAAGCNIKVMVLIQPITVWVNGELILNGTGTAPVTVSADAVEPEPGFWNGFVLRGLEDYTLNYASIQHAAVALDVQYTARLNVKNSIFENNSVAGIRFNNFQHTDGKMYAPRNAVLEDTTFIHNSWGIIENGILTTISGCEFIENDPGGILIGNGSYPFSSDLEITGNTFRLNRNASIQIGQDETRDFGISDIDINKNEFWGSVENPYRNLYYVYSKTPARDILIHDNDLMPGYYHSMIHLDHCDNLTLSQNDLHGNDDERSAYGLYVKEFNGVTVSRNRVHDGRASLHARDGDHVLFEYNTFIIAGGETGSGTSTYNVTDVVYHHNRGRTGISTMRSSPASIYNNVITEGYISSLVACLSRRPGIIDIFNNTVSNAGDSAISSAENPYTHIHDNIIVDSSRDALSLDGGGMEGCMLLIENNTIQNTTRFDIHTDSLSPGHVFYILVRNTTLDTEKVKISWNASVRVSWFMKVRTENEIGGHIDSVMNVQNGTGILERDHHVSGEWRLVQGPYLEFVYDWRNPYYMRSEPKYQDTLCGLTFTSGERNWDTRINWTKYIELEVTLDGDPEFIDPGTLHFEEDTAFEFDINDHFQDLDEIVIEILDTDGNLNFTDGNVEATNENWFGTSNVTFRATDTFGNFTDGTVSFMIDPVNDAPAIHPEIEDISIDEDTVFVLELAQYMFDVEEDPLEWTVVAGENITVELDNATWNLTITSYPDWSGNTSITLHLNDTRLESEEIIGINVQPVNDAPVFDTPENWNVTVQRGQLTKIDLLPMVTDVENDVIGFSMDITSIHITISGGEMAILFPEDSEITLLTLVITASDGNGGEVSRTLLLIVEEPGEQPEELWELYSAGVDIDENGEWTVYAAGLPDLKVFIVISGEDGVVGSFELTEDEGFPGNYSTMIESDNFEMSEPYFFYFTNVSGGQELASGLAGSVVQPGKEVEDEPSYLMIILGGICISLLLLLLLIIGIFALMRRSSRRDDEE